MLKNASFALALSLLLLGFDGSAAASAPHASFSHGFSSHASSHSSSHSSTPHSTPSAPKSGFGSFSSRSSGSQAAAPAKAPSGSFGSFGNASSAPKQSDSALSQQLSKNSAQANALRTLDERNAAKSSAAAQNAPQPAPGYAQPAPAQQGYGQAPTTVIVNNNSGGGLGHVLAGAMIARSANANAHAGYYPGGPYQQTQQTHGGGFFSTFVTLVLLVAIAWGLWFAWRGFKRRRAAAAEANKPNYSFDQN